MPVSGSLVMFGTHTFIFGSTVSSTFLAGLAALAPLQPLGGGLHPLPGRVSHVLPRAPGCEGERREAGEDARAAVTGSPGPRSDGTDMTRGPHAAMTRAARPTRQPRAGSALLGGRPTGRRARWFRQA